MTKTNVVNEAFDELKDLLCFGGRHLLWSLDLNFFFLYSIFVNFVYQYAAGKRKKCNMKRFHFNCCGLS